MVVVIMGTTGAGKTTIGSLLAVELDWPFADADDYHSAENLVRMRSGIPLTDDDRGPWLESLRKAIEAWLANDEDVVLACSALRRSYRTQLHINDRVTFVYLKGDREVFEERVSQRRGHFAKANLLASQFATLEEPSPEEAAIVVSATDPPREIVANILRALNLDSKVDS
jgi:gluconokinase